MQVDDFQGFPVLLAEPVHALASYFVVAQEELLQVGPLLVGQCKGALVADVAETQVELLQGCPFDFCEVFDALIVEDVSA